MTTATMTLPHGKSHPRDLRTIFQFTDADLEANAKGEMTTSQIEQMQHNQLVGLRWSVGIMWGMCAAFIGIFVFIMRSSGYDLRDDATIAAILLGVFVGLPAIFFLFSLYQIRQYYQTKDDVAVSMVDGTLSKRSYRIKRSEFYELHIGGMKFDTGADAYSILRDGLLYRIYYVASTKYILSIEPVAQL